MPRYARHAAALALTATFAAGAGSAPPESPFTWTTVVNNGDYVPTDLCDPAAPSASCRTFNSYNQPSVNADGLVVFRARSRGGQGLGEATHGVYIRHMGTAVPVARLFDRDTRVPQPNNRSTEFTEPPSFPRIDIGSDTVATRGNHQPVWKVLNEAGETVAQLGTSGIYTNPFGALITGTSKLGSVPAFSFFEVPERPGTYFDVFPGAPAVTDGNIIVFKGNYTADLVGRTGVYYRELVNAPVPDADGAPLAPAGGTQRATLIANNSDTLIPGTSTVFGSTAPPSAANRTAVFAGFDNEDNPALGGIYLALLNGPRPMLTTLVGIGDRVPGEHRDVRFTRLGEGVSFDGRFVAFWGAWGTQTTTLVLRCPTEGNRDRIAYCNTQHPNGFTARVPVHQGVFVYDTETRQLRIVARTPTDFNDFVYWNFSGRVPGAGGGDGEDDGELARWRCTAFVAVSGMVDAGLGDAGFHAAFKARTGAVSAGSYQNPLDGVYLRKGPGSSKMLTLVETGMAGTRLDPLAFDPDTGAPLPVTGMGIERDGFRGRFLVVNASMGGEHTGWGGVYLTEVWK